MTKRQNKGRKGHMYKIQTSTTSSLKPTINPRCCRKGSPPQAQKPLQQTETTHTSLKPEYTHPPIPPFFSGSRESKGRKRWTTDRGMRVAENLDESDLQTQK